MPSPSRSLTPPFILSNGATKPDPHTRKLIRSYVMRGKNRGKSRHDKAQDAETPTKALECECQGLPVDQALTIIYRKIGTDLAFFPFADTIEPKAAANALNAAITVAKARYALQTCLIFTDLGTAWIRQLAIDASFLQSFILMCQLYFDIVGGGDSSYSSQVNVLKTIQLLRKKLFAEDKSSQLSDTTVFVVLNLAVHAFLHGDDKSSRHHLLGISKIADLRGGLNEFRETKMLLELFRQVIILDRDPHQQPSKSNLSPSRCDLGLALHTGAEPVLLRDYDPSWQQLLLYPPEVGFCREDDSAFDGVDKDLLAAWNSMKGFCSLVNLAVEARGKILWTLYLNTMTPVMYRLLRMKFESDSVSEAVRLALLTFSSHVFLQWKVVTIIYGHLAVSYETCLERLRLSNDVPSHLLSWLLMVGAISVFKDSGDTWFMLQLRESIETSAVNSWDEMRGILRDFMWIGVVQDHLGREIFNRVRSMGDDV